MWTIAGLNPREWQNLKSFFGFQKGYGGSKELFANKQYHLKTLCFIPRSSLTKSKLTSVSNFLTRFNYWFCCKYCVEIFLFCDMFHQTGEENIDHYVFKHICVFPCTNETWQVCIRLSMVKVNIFCG